ncbi:hypothetical protein PAMC26577_38785 [Caballeronia sordidicola]|uniref:Uncharacterized protein n=1 Tax=Caballeronia sordidicola TaxID=196367 RepID=A0A242M4H6_CABSO|nr:hypothetical protein PAMC26577_38785 [Caballeronia sordidicola]
MVIGASANGIVVSGRSADGTTMTTVMGGAIKVTGTAETITISPISAIFFHHGHD